MDLAIAVFHLVPDADYRRADDYATLVATWHDARPVPTEDELLAVWATIEEASINQDARATIRAALLEKWDALPAWIRGPFQDKFAAANTLLDAGQDDAAEAIIQYAEVPTAYSVEQVAIFAAVRAELLAALSGIPPVS